MGGGNKKKVPGQKVGCGLLSHCQHRNETRVELQSNACLGCRAKLGPGRRDVGNRDQEDVNNISEDRREHDGKNALGRTEGRKEDDQAKRAFH